MQQVEQGVQATVIVGQHREHRRALGDRWNRDDLAAAGRVGFDLHEGAWFHRDLPLTSAPAPGDVPRLRDALALVDSGAVSLDDAGSAVVRGGDDRVVRVDPGGGYTCSCPWWAKHGGGRGPCKHVLAVHVVRRRED